MRINQFGSFTSNIVQAPNVAKNGGSNMFVLGAGLLGTVIVRVKRKKEAGEKKFVKHSEYADALERIETVSSLLKNVTKEKETTKSELAIVVNQKNAVERLLEELEKAKQAVERDLENTRSRHKQKVTSWRNEIIAYREKKPKDFLAEVVGLVSDMDNEISIEVVPGPGGVLKQKKTIEIIPCTDKEVEEDEDWEHNPIRFALEDSARLSILANLGHSVKEGKKKNKNAEKIIAANNNTNRKQVHSPAQVKKVATPMRQAFSKLTNNNLTKNIAEKIETLVKKPSEKNSLKHSSDDDAQLSNVEFTEMLMVSSDEDGYKKATKASKVKLGAAKKLISNVSWNKAGVVAETVFGVSDVKRAFSCNDQKLEYVSPGEKKNELATIS